MGLRHPVPVRISKRRFLPKETWQIYIYAYVSLCSKRPDKYRYIRIYMYISFTKRDLTNICICIHLFAYQKGPDKYKHIRMHIYSSLTKRDMYIYIYIYIYAYVSLYSNRDLTNIHTITLSHPLRPYSPTNLIIPPTYFQKSSGLINYEFWTAFVHAWYCRFGFSVPAESKNLLIVFCKPS